MASSNITRCHRIEISPKLLATLGTIFFSLVLLTACPPPPSGLPPQWAVTDTLVNANSPGFNHGDARTVVFFSKIPWQTSNRGAPAFANGWRNDVLVGSAYSFQVIVSGGNFANGGLILRDAATGADLQPTPARVNHPQDCGAAFGAAPSLVECYRDPGQPGFIQRPALPTAAPSYSVELVESCMGTLKYTDLRCPLAATNPNGPQATADTATVLTISPPRSPSIPVHGQKFLYDIVSRNANGEQSTRITAVYVDPKRCTIDNLVLTPAIQASGSVGNVGDLIQVQWTARDCFQVRVTTSDPYAPGLDYWQVPQNDEASEPHEGNIVPYALPKLLSVAFAVEATDAMGASTTKSQTEHVSPCSVNPASSNCPMHCNTMPRPADCPAPKPPQCPVGQGDMNRQDLQYTFTILCSGSDTTHQETDYGCTQAAALQAAKNRWQGSNCGPGMGVLTSPDSGGTTPAAQACMNGATQQDWKVCLMCGTTTPQTLTIKACSETDAEAAADLNCPNQLPTVSAGECQKP